LERKGNENARGARMENVVSKIASMMSIWRNDLLKLSDGDCKMTAVVMFPKIPNIDTNGSDNPSMYTCKLGTDE
jgi:hypothetical protein